MLLMLLLLCLMWLQLLQLLQLLLLLLCLLLMLLMLLLLCLMWLQLLLLLCLLLLLLLALALCKTACTCLQTLKPSAPAFDNLQRIHQSLPLCISPSGISLRRACLGSSDSPRWDVLGLGHRNIFLHQLTWSGIP